VIQMNELEEKKHIQEKYIIKCNKKLKLD